jgi:hypothetical protein
MSFGRTDQSQTGMAICRLGPAHHLQRPTPGCFSQEQRAGLADWGARGHIAGRHKHGRASHRVRAWQPVAHTAAGDLADLGLVPPVLEAHMHPIHLGHQQLGRRVQWLSCLLSLSHRGCRGALALDQRGANLLGVAAHRLTAQLDSGQAPPSLNCLLEGQLAPGLRMPGLLQQVPFLWFQRRASAMNYVATADVYVVGHLASEHHLCIDTTRHKITGSPHRSENALFSEP